MIELTREIRLSLTAAATEELTQPPASNNSWAGWPAAAELAPFLLLRITIAGQPDAATGYLRDIKELDNLLYEVVRSTMQLLAHQPRTALTAEQYLHAVVRRLPAQLAPGIRFRALQLLPCPYLRYTLRSESPDMIEYTEQFEFAAAHRLHCAELSKEQNSALFGKCNNPNGHGHNYVVEVTVAGKAFLPAESSLRRHLETIVKDRVLDRFDHKHLNEDTIEFRRLNPTVENITLVIWDLLVEALAPVRLLRVRVYETPKTWAEYRGPAP
jgi:6-pyruvoyltetrahydropterin/6-carboxytetrahydropterin synthase